MSRVVLATTDGPIEAEVWVQRDRSGDIRHVFATATNWPSGCGWYRPMAEEAVCLAVRDGRVRL